MFERFRLNRKLTRIAAELPRALPTAMRELKQEGKLHLVSEDFMEKTLESFVEGERFTEIGLISEIVKDQPGLAETFGPAAFTKAFHEQIKMHALIKVSMLRQLNSTPGGSLLISKDVLAPIIDSLFRYGNFRYGKYVNLIEAVSGEFKQNPHAISALEEALAVHGGFMKHKHGIPLDAQRQHYSIFVHVSDKNVSITAGCHKREPWARLQNHWLTSSRDVTPTRIEHYIPETTAMLERALAEPMLSAAKRTLVRQTLQQAEMQRLEAGVIAAADALPAQAGIKLGPYIVLEGSRAHRAIVNYMPGQPA
jgi:hypothetical protein